MTVLALAIGLEHEPLHSLQSRSRSNSGQSGIRARWSASGRARTDARWHRRPTSIRYLRQHVTTLKGLAAHTPPDHGTRVRAPGRADASLKAAWASANFFDVLSVRFQLGSGFISVDDEPGNRRAPVVISDSAWRVYFASDPGVIGLPVLVADKPFTIVGVLEPRFDGINVPVEVWMPLSAFPGMRAAPAWDGRRRIQPTAVCRWPDGWRAARAVQESLQELQLLHERFSTASGRNRGPGRSVRDVRVLAPGSASRYGLFARLRSRGPARPGARVRKRRQSATGARAGAAPRDRHSPRTRREPRPGHPATSDRRRWCWQALPARSRSASRSILPPLVFSYIGEEIPPYMRARFLPDGADRLLRPRGLRAVVPGLRPRPGRSRDASERSPSAHWIVGRRALRASTCAASCWRRRSPCARCCWPAPGSSPAPSSARWRQILGSSSTACTWSQLRFRPGLPSKDRQALIRGTPGRARTGWRRSGRGRLVPGRLKRRGM